MVARQLRSSLFYLSGILTMFDRNKAFSLSELMFVVLLLGIFALIAVARMNFAIITKQKTAAAAEKIATDLRRTRSLAISNAATNTSGYALNTTSTSSYEIVNLDTSTTVDSLTTQFGVSITDGAVFEFGPLGNLLVGSDSSMSVSGGGKGFTISIVSATGTVKCTED
jgi:prepilin-type N-terminal cleavage/methylation domain-containing protein